ncbi:MAG: diacylglycerol kinase family protein [Prolixibacteraceae bacterium]
MKNEKFSLRKRIQSFGFALNGLKIMLREEHNSRIHLFCACLVIGLMFIFNLSPIEIGLLIMVIGMVFTAELFNSALENLADHLSPEKNEKIKKVKDLSAAAVLVSALTALIVGCMIFLPKILELIQLT